jgi:hypothetical protein
MKWIISHCVVVVIAVTVAWGVLHAFYREHEARALAEQTVKQQTQDIKTSQLAIAQLEAEIAATNAHAAAADRALKSALATVKTPAQAVAAIPSVSDVPLNVRVAPDNPLQVSVDAVALYSELNQCAQSRVDLSACQKNAANFLQISADKDQQLAADKTIITVLKKKPSFFHRLKTTFEIIGISLGIGMAIGAHFA